MNLPNYEIVADSSQSLILRDVGPWDRHPTITNGINQLLPVLIQRGILNNDKRLFYYDSEGDFGELLHRDGEFLGFKPAIAP